MINEIIMVMVDRVPHKVRRLQKEWPGGLEGYVKTLLGEARIVVGREDVPDSDMNLIRMVDEVVMEIALNEALSDRSVDQEAD